MTLQKFIILPYERYILLTQNSKCHCEMEVGDAKDKRQYLQLLPEVDNIEKPNFDHVLSLFPRNIRNKSKVILSYIDRESKISWNEKLELCIKGVPIRNSNIVDLIKSVQYRYKNFNPPGKRPFLAFLKKANIPKTCVTKWKHI